MMTGALDDQVSLLRATQLEARCCAVGDPDARFAWALWKTAAQIDQLQQQGCSWSMVQERLGASKVGSDQALWDEVGRRNPDFLATACQILEDEADKGSYNRKPRLR